jgi:glutamine amidotransferase
MTRLFGCTCNEPQRIAQALESVRPVLTAPGPVPRWGLGYVQAGEVLLRRHPRGGDDSVDFFEALQNLQSDYIIGYASQPDGLAGNANTQPFRFRHWLYAQEGGFDGFEAMQPRLLERIPEFLQRNIAGKTPAEHFFNVFLAHMYEAGSLDDPNVPVGVIRRALRDSTAVIESIAAESGARGTPGNVVVTNSRTMLALRLELPVFLRRFKQADPRRSDNKHFRAVLALSADAEPGEGFEAIPPRSVLTISRDLQTDVIELDV